MVCFRLQPLACLKLFCWQSCGCCVTLHQELFFLALSFSEEDRLHFSLAASKGTCHRPESSVVAPWAPRQSSLVQFVSQPTYGPQVACKVCLIIAGSTHSAQPTPSSIYQCQESVWNGFRLSCHSLPIKTGRRVKPSIPPHCKLRWETLHFQQWICTGCQLSTIFSFLALICSLPYQTPWQLFSPKPIVYIPVIVSD